MKMNKDNFRIYLRPLEIDDCYKIHPWRNDPVYQDGVASVKRYVSLETEKKWVENAIKEHENLKSIRLAIINKESNDIIGLSSLKNLNFLNSNARYNFFIGQDRRKGFATEAHILTLAYSFLELGLERIAAGVLENNIASIKSLEKVGFIKEGHSRNAIYKNGIYQNLFEYSILRDEFEELYVR